MRSKVEKKRRKKKKEKNWVYVVLIVKILNLDEDAFA